MSIERIIGIDFGTSTSVIRVKRYQDGKPLGERLDVKEVTFNSMGQSLVPTLIQKIQDGVPYYGYEAQKAHKKSTLFQNFKINLESPDLEKRKQARSLTEEFFAYMAKQYKDQSSGGFLGEASDIEKTMISYPVKWSEETRAFMLEAARKAGFPNVEGMDEAQAAITAVMVQSADNLSKKGYLYDGVPITILMADMGAGTTDLVLCRYTPGKNAGYEVLSVWPIDGNTLFGGGEVERMLQDYLRSKLPEQDADVVMKRCGLDKFKSWKETMVSPALTRGETVTECSELEQITELLEIDVEDYALDRAEFERLAGNYLKGFPELVKGCLQNAGIAGSNVDLVLLTGGHSQWYFVKEQLKGGLNQGGEIDLGKIKADSERIISVPRPQETVALGLVYSPMMKIRFAQRSEQRNVPQTAPQINETISFALAIEDICSLTDLTGRRGTVVTGLIQKGSIKTGERLFIYGKNGIDEFKSCIVAGIEKSKKIHVAAYEGDAVGLLLKGIREDEVAVGDVLYKTDSVFQTENPNPCISPSELFEFRAVDGGFEVAKYVGELEAVMIPDEYCGKPVVAIGEHSFLGMKLCKLVDIPSNVVIIKEQAFMSSGLESVNLHRGLQKISAKAFCYCRLKSVVLPDSLLEIGSDAFRSNCLSKIDIPLKCHTIGEGAFAQNKDLSEFNVSMLLQLKKMGRTALLNTNVQSVILPVSCECNELIRRLRESGGLFKKALPPEYIDIKRY